MVRSCQNTDTHKPPTHILYYYMIIIWYYHIHWWFKKLEPRHTHTQHSAYISFFDLNMVFSRPTSRAIFTIDDPCPFKNLKRTPAMEAWETWGNFLCWSIIFCLKNMNIFLIFKVIYILISVYFDVFVYVYIYICIYLFIHTSLGIYLHIHMNININEYVYIYI